MHVLDAYDMLAVSYDSLRYAEEEHASARRQRDIALAEAAVQGVPHADIADILGMTGALGTVAVAIGRAIRNLDLPLPGGQGSRIAGNRAIREALDRLHNA